MVSIGSLNITKSDTLDNLRKELDNMHIKYNDLKEKKAEQELTYKTEIKCLVKNITKMK